MENGWRLIIDDALSGIENMARDAALLEWTDKEEKPVTTLRFYRWMVPTLSLGAKQELEKTVDLDFCRGNGIDIVRRPTGGGAVLHHLEITYSVISNDKTIFPQSTILGTYLSIAQALQQGLELLNVPAEIVEKKLSDTVRPDNYVKNPVPCFTAASHYEICAKGRKIIGSAQKRSKRAFLQHGSIPYQYDWRMQAGAMRSNAAEMKELMSCVADFNTPPPGCRALYEAFLSAFSQVFKVKFSPYQLQDAEMALVRQLINEFKINY